MENTQDITYASLIKAGWTNDQILNSEFSHLLPQENNEETQENNEETQENNEETQENNEETPIIAVKEEITIKENVKNNILKDHIYEVPKKNIAIKANLSKSSVQIECVIHANNQSEKVIALHNEIKLISGRTYYIPIETNTQSPINSDDYNIKVFGEVAPLIDVRSIENDKIVITPIRHNTIIRNEQRLCLLIPIE